MYSNMPCWLQKSKLEILYANPVSPPGLSGTVTRSPSTPPCFSCQHYLICELVLPAQNDLCKNVYDSYAWHEGLHSNIAHMCRGLQGTVAVACYSRFENSKSPNLSGEARPAALPQGRVCDQGEKFEETLVEGKKLCEQELFCSVSH